MEKRFRKCGNCSFLVRTDGEPYYCAVRDLYSFRKENDRACKDWEAEEYDDLGNGMKSEG